ncbi:uncharacterized protein LOC132708598 isoform X2 [Cylas formicarius]|uniref:uncharacterized protein LOC132708598 isoform X2 n=1 Tax=Cylas formicarius TaxID=197179 RepID=UPI00295861CE|nr:uncharacterized protein LOC132708598 isoform X2 [Cylas formicarius]
MDKRRGRPLISDAVILKPLAFNLEEALEVESVYRPNLLLVQSDLKAGEVTLTLRDGAVNILRFLHIWLDLPRNVYFSAVSYLDMFLAKMRVSGQRKFLFCLVIAADTENQIIDVDYLVKISQGKCTSRDVLRMAKIVKEKLKLVDKCKPTTVEDFFKIYLEVFTYLTRKWEHIISRNLLQIKEHMLTRLEVLLADSSTAFYRSSLLALVLFRLEVENLMAHGLPKKSVYFLGEFLHFFTIIWEIQSICKVKNSELKPCYATVSKVIRKYCSQRKSDHHEELSWKFSFSTIEKSKRNNYHPFLPTISE